MSDDHNTTLKAIEEVLHSGTEDEDLPATTDHEEYYNRLYAAVASETDVADMWGIDYEPLSEDSSSLDPMSVDEDYIYVSSGSDTEEAQPDPEDLWDDHFDANHPANWDEEDFYTVHDILSASSNNFVVPEHNQRKRRRIMPDLQGIENKQNPRHDSDNNDL